MMVVLLAYLYYIQWEVAVDKEMFAVMSTIELSLEVYLLVAWVVAYKLTK